MDVNEINLLCSCLFSFLNPRSSVLTFRYFGKKSQQSADKAEPETEKKTSSVMLDCSLLEDCVRFLVEKFDWFLCFCWILGHLLSYRDILVLICIMCLTKRFFKTYRGVAFLPRQAKSQKEEENSFYVSTTLFCVYTLFRGIGFSSPVFLGNSCSCIMCFIH